MSIVSFKTRCILKPKVGDNVYGEPEYGNKIVTRCVVIKLKKIRQATTVRTDSSATRGHADEDIAEARLLFSDKENIALGDYVEVMGHTIRITAIRYRLDACGELDHYEVDAAIE